MNLNGNISLKVPTASDLKKLLPLLKRSESTLIGVALIVIFGYTAFVVQKAINVGATTDDTTVTKSITFDQKTLNSLKTRTNVDGSTPSGNLGTASPFGN